MTTLTSGKETPPSRHAQGSCSIVPRRIEDINADWVGRFIDNVQDACVLNVLHGTAIKIQIEVAFHTSPETRRRYWIKAGFEPQNSKIGQAEVHAGEVLYYRTLANSYDTRTPRCLLAETDSEGRSVIVMEDLADIGARFITPTSAGTPALVASGLTAIARYQASSWMDASLNANDWLRSGGAVAASNVLGWLYDPAHWEAYSNRPRFALLPAPLRDRERLRDAHSRLHREWLPRAPWALSHGDAHFGQIYVLPDGEVRFMDWQCVRLGHWAHDVSYFLAGALSVEDRRYAEKDLLHHYLAQLAGFGIGAPTFDQAWDAYRAHVTHGISWAMCFVELQSEDNCVAMTERFAAAMTDLDSLSLLLGGR